VLLLACPTNVGPLSLRNENHDRYEIAETVFERNQRRETEINDALKQEYARREAAIKNMYRLRALRLARDTKLNNPN
jgi:hypothetical protein